MGCCMCNAKVRQLKDFLEKQIDQQNIAVKPEPLINPKGCRLLEVICNERDFVLTTSRKEEEEEEKREDELSILVMDTLMESACASIRNRIKDYTI